MQRLRDGGTLPAYMPFFFGVLLGLLAFYGDCTSDLAFLNSWLREE